MSEVLTGADVIHLSTIIDAASRGAKVRWMLEGDGDIGEGVARHLVNGPNDFGLARGDVRDAHLRITTMTGMETTVPVRRLMWLVSIGGFAVDS